MEHLQGSRGADCEAATLDSGTQRVQGTIISAKDVVSSFHFRSRSMRRSTWLARHRTVGEAPGVLARTGRSRAAGRDIRISVVADKETAKAKELTGGKARVTADASEVVRDAEVDIVIELIGGVTGEDLILAAIENGKHVVTRTRRCSPPTATRFSPRRRRRGDGRLRGRVAGGIPIIKALREGLTANRIEWIAGIINGTRTSSSRRCARRPSFAAVLKEPDARLRRGRSRLRYRGRGPAHKSPSWRRSPSASRCSWTNATRSIARLTQEEIRYAEQLGYRIKLLGSPSTLRRASSCACTRR